MLLLDSAFEFAEISLPAERVGRLDPAAVLHIRTITGEIFEYTSCELLATILKAMQSWQEIFPV